MEFGRGRNRHAVDRRRFLHAHWGEMAGSDFFTTEVWTWRGLVTYDTVCVIDLASGACRSPVRRSIPTVLHAARRAR